MTVVLGSSGGNVIVYLWEYMSNGIKNLYIYLYTQALSI